jgi:hypothetical protein
MHIYFTILNQYGNSTPNPKPQTPNNKLQTPNPKPQTTNKGVHPKLPPFHPIYLQKKILQIILAHNLGKNTFFKIF